MAALGLAVDFLAAAFNADAGFVRIVVVFLAMFLVYISRGEMPIAVTVCYTTLSMNYHSAPSQTILDTLQTTQNGLSPQESAWRLVQYGPNTLTVKGRPLWRTIIEPFTSVFVAVLFVAAGISFWQGAPLDAWIVIGVILISAIIYYIQEFSTERILRSLRKKDNATIRVRYADGERVISVERIVPGDIIILEEGDKVPADCRIIDLRSVRVDESQLTGESLPIEKQVRPVKDAAPLYERSCMLYQGSFVIGGTAAAVVTATGNHTEFGKLAVLAKDQNNQSPVQQKIDKLIEKTLEKLSAPAYTLLQSAAVDIQALITGAGESWIEQMKTQSAA